MGLAVGFSLLSGFAVGGSVNTTNDKLLQPCTWLSFILVHLVEPRSGFVMQCDWNPSVRFATLGFGMKPHSG